jgi:uncharacterized membrane protein
MDKSKKAQISVEFLVIMGIILLIALVVIAIVTFFIQSSSELNQSQIEFYWSTQASPIRIVQMQGYYYNSYPNLGEIALVLENKDSKPITIKSFVLEPYDSEYTFSVYANHSTTGSSSGLTLYGQAGPNNLNGLDILINPGEKVAVYLRTTLACSNSSATDYTSPEKFLNYLTIYYQTPYFSDLSFKGLKPIAGRCSQN